MSIYKFPELPALAPPLGCPRGGGLGCPGLPDPVGKKPPLACGWGWGRSACPQVQTLPGGHRLHHWPPGWAWDASAEGPEGAWAASAGLPTIAGFWEGSRLDTRNCGVGAELRGFLPPSLSVVGILGEVERGHGEQDRHWVTRLALGEGAGILAAWVPKLGKWGGSPSGAEVVGLTWGQQNSCARDGCGSGNCHLESDRRGLQWTQLCRLDRLVPSAGSRPPYS